MTKEEAIKTLRELWRETNDSWYEETYNMAIEALQRTSNAHPTHESVKPTHECVELISREAALDILCDFQTYIENGVDSYAEHLEKLLMRVLELLRIRAE